MQEYNLNRGKIADATNNLNSIKTLGNFVTVFLLITIVMFFYDLLDIGWSWWLVWSGAKVILSFWVAGTLLEYSYRQDQLLTTLKNYTDYLFSHQNCTLYDLAGFMQQPIDEVKRNIHLFIGYHYFYRVILRDEKDQLIFLKEASPTVPPKMIITCASCGADNILQKDEIRRCDY